MSNFSSLLRILFLAVLAGGWLGIAEPALASLTLMDVAKSDAADAAKSAAKSAEQAQADADAAEATAAGMDAGTVTFDEQEAADASAAEAAAYADLAQQDANAAAAASANAAAAEDLAAAQAAAAQAQASAADAKYSAKDAESARTDAQIVADRVAKRAEKEKAEKAEADNNSQSSADVQHRMNLLGNLQGNLVMVGRVPVQPPHIPRMVHRAPPTYRAPVEMPRRVIVLRVGPSR